MFKTKCSSEVTIRSRCTNSVTLCWTLDIFARANWISLHKNKINIRHRKILFENASRLKLLCMCAYLKSYQNTAPLYTDEIHFKQSNCHCLLSMKQTTIHRTLFETFRTRQQLYILVRVHPFLYTSWNSEPSLFSKWIQWD